MGFQTEIGGLNYWRFYIVIKSFRKPGNLFIGPTKTSERTTWIKASLKSIQVTVNCCSKMKLLEITLPFQKSYRMQ